jgi:hypothetical protein
MHIPRISIPLCMELIRADTHTWVKELALLYSTLLYSTLLYSWSIIHKIKFSLIHHDPQSTYMTYKGHMHIWTFINYKIDLTKTQSPGSEYLLLSLKIRCAEEELLQRYNLLVGTYQLPGDLHFLFLVCFVFVVCLFVIALLKFHIRISEFQICWPCLQRQGYYCV